MAKKIIMLVLSVEILEEYKRIFEILSKEHPPIDLTPFLELVAREALFFEAIILPESVCRDPDDDKFIACTLAANADYLISGDKDLLMVNYKEVHVIKPSTFVKNHLS